MSIKFFIIFSILYLSAISSLFSENNFDSSSITNGCEMGLSYSIDNQNNSVKFIDIGLGITSYSNSMINPLVEINASFGLDKAGYNYILSMIPCLRIGMNDKSDLKVYIDVGAGYSTLKVINDNKAHSGVIARTGFGLGYKNLFTFANVSYIFNKDYSVNPLSIGLKYRL